MAESNRKPVEFVVGAKDSEALAAFARVTAKLEGMMAPIRRVQDALNKPLNQAGLGQLTNKLGNLRAAMSAVPVAGTLFATGGITAATAALVRNSTAAVDSVSKIQDLSDAYKISTDSLQVFTEVGADSGVMQEEIAKSMGFFQQKIAGARSGEAGALEFMAKIGVDTKTLQKDLPSIMGRVANVFRDSTKDTDDALKVDLAKGGFGKGGAQMIAVLERGGGEIKKVYDSMLAEGRIFSKEEISGIDEIGDVWGATVRRFDHFKKVIGLGMTPMLKSISDAFDKFMASDSKPQMIETFKKIGESIGETIPRIAEDLPDLISGLATMFRWLDRIGKIVGWDRIIAGLALMVASPFIASTMLLGKAVFSVGWALGVFAAKLALLGGGLIATAISGLAGLQAAMVMVGLSGAAAWAIVIAPLVVLAGLAWLVYQNWDKVKALFVGFWEGFSQGLSPIGDMLGALWSTMKPILVGIGTALGLIGEKTGSSAESLRSWGSAGKAAGEILASVFRLALVPITVVLDAIYLVIAGIQKLRGLDFKMPGLTSKLWPGGDVSRPAIASPSISQVGKQEVGGSIAVEITDSRAMVRKIDSYGGLDLTASSGSMYRTGP